jgi:hypothetical protein
VAISSIGRVSFEPAGPGRDLLQAKRGSVRFMDVPSVRFFMVDGHGAPGSDEFREAFGVLYPIAYTLHFNLKRRGIVAPVGALEGLYWLSGDRPLDAGLRGATTLDPAEFEWRLMPPVPAEATEGDIAAAIDEVARKKAPPALLKLRVETWQEGEAAQTLHVGPYEAEQATLALLRQAIAEKGLRAHGRHHEIYISDPNRTAPERLKTIIRMHVKTAA